MSAELLTPLLPLVHEAARAESGAMSLVEAFSLPGGGKSTLVRALAGHGQIITVPTLAAAWSRLSPPRRGLHIGRGMADLACLRAALRFAVGARLWKGDSLVRLLRMVSKAHWLRSQPGVVLLDQGFLQNIWSICVSAERFEVEERLLVPLIRCLYRGIDAQILFLEIDDATAALRVSRRTDGNSRFDGLSLGAIQARLSRKVRLTEVIASSAAAAGLPVQKLDGRAEIATLADKLRPLLPQPGRG